MNHSAIRKRQSPFESNDTSLNPITDFEWKNLLARRQNCKERVTKMKDGIDSATDRIQRIEINKSSKVNEKSCVTSSAFSFQETKDFHNTNQYKSVQSNQQNNLAFDNMESNDSRIDYARSSTATLRKSSKLPDTSSRPLTDIPSRFAGLARNQTSARNELLGFDDRRQSKMQYRGASSTCSNQSTYSSSSSNSKYSMDLTDTRSRSQSTSSSHSFSSPNSSSGWVGNGVSNKDRLGLDKIESYLDNFNCTRKFVESDTKRVKQNIETGFDKREDVRALYGTENISSITPSYRKDLSPPWHNNPSWKNQDNSHNPSYSYHSSDSPNSNLLSSNAFLLLSNERNISNISNNSVSKTSMNKNIMQKQSSDVKDRTNASYINNRENEGQNKNEGLNNSTTSHVQHNRNVNSCIVDNESSHNYLKSLCNCDTKVRHCPMHSTREAQINVTIKSTVSTSKRNEEKQLPLPIHYHDFEIDYGSNEDYGYTSFHVRRPLFERANVVLAKFHPVTLVCDSPKSVFYCEKQFSSSNIDLNNNIQIASSVEQMKTNSIMASTVTYMQRIIKFCDLTNTINTINCGKRVGSFNVSRNVHDNSCNKPAVDDNHPMTNSNLKPINEYSPDAMKNLDGITINTKLGERNIDPNRSIVCLKETEDSGSEWEYYSDDENADERKDPVSSYHNTFHSIHAKSSSLRTDGKQHLALLQQNMAKNDTQKHCNDPWSPYLKTVTFDITGTRTPELALTILELKYWLECVSNIENNSTIRNMNHKYHHHYPLCRNVNRDGDKDILFSSSDSMSNGSQNEQEMKEGEYTEFVKDPKTDEPSVLQIANYCNGVKHGFYRKFTASFGQSKQEEFKKFMSVGHFSKGKETGIRWRWLEGNAYFVDLKGENEDWSGSNVGFYLYPSLSCGIHGKWLKNKLEYGKFFRTTSFRFDEYGMPIPEIEFPTNRMEVQNTFTRDLSTTVCISKYPSIRDPYEHQTIYVAKSRQGKDAGEGVFAKRFIPKGSLVALFNGFRQRDTTIHSKKMPEFSDYRIALDRCVSLDIPEKFKNISAYRATLGHKACHSFENNSVFHEINHPRFGNIMSVVAKEDINCHEEVLVHYNYRICQAPEWYVNLWFEHLRENENLTEEEIYQAAKKESRLSQLPLTVPPPKRTSPRFLPCGRCKGHVGLEDSSFTCDICEAWHHLSCSQNDTNDLKLYLENDEPITCDECSLFR